jgi:hypothetical protein
VKRTTRCGGSAGHESDEELEARPTRLAVILQRSASKLPLDDAVFECLECEDEHVPWSWCFVLLSRIGACHHRRYIVQV